MSSHETDHADTALRAVASSTQKFRPNSTSEAAAMTKCLLYMAPIALVGLMAAQASAAPAALTGGMARAIAGATAERTDAPLVLVRGGGGRGGVIDSRIACWGLRCLDEIIGELHG